MSHTALIDISVALALFVGGMSWTVRKYARHDQAAFTVVAIVSPVLMVVALFRVLYLASFKDLSIGPCPVGFEDAERAVEQERVRLFGGELREPMFSKSWQLAYEQELQREAAKVEGFAMRVLQHA